MNYLKRLRSVSAWRSPEIEKRKSCTWLRRHAYIHTDGHIYSYIHQTGRYSIEGPQSSKERVEWISEYDEGAFGSPYREAIGSLMYLMIGSRPNIAFAVGKVARFCESPETKHWFAGKWGLRSWNSRLWPHCWCLFTRGSVYGLRPDQYMDKEDPSV